MSSKRIVIDSSNYKQSKKPVYVLSDLYENITSDEEDFQMENKTRDFDWFEDISVESENGNTNLVDNLLEDWNFDAEGEEPQAHTEAPTVSRKSKVNKLLVIMTQTAITDAWLLMTLIMMSTNIIICMRISIVTT